jgi:hypothetical protein
MVPQHRCNVAYLVLLGAVSAAAAGLCLGDGAPHRKYGEGIWKAAVPANPMTGEFESLDPIGVAAGARIKADCSLNWISPDSGKRYCFSSGTSLEFFLDRPQANIERAQTAWRKMTGQQQ